jgi:hypothetical protein
MFPYLVEVAQRRVEAPAEELALGGFGILAELEEGEGEPA